MVQDGLMDRFRIEEVYGMHNYPGLPVGQFALRPSPLMAAADRITIEIEGRGGAAARPAVPIDTALGCAHILSEIHTIAPRHASPPTPTRITTSAFPSASPHPLIHHTPR